MARATTEVAKQQKKEHILNVTTKLFAGCCFENLTMQQIAKECGVSKGTMFNYFASKELLFFEIFLKQSEELTSGLFSFLKRQGTISFDEFKTGFIKEVENYIKSNPLGLKLLAIKNTVLEQNIPHDYAKQTKLKTHKSIEKLMQDVASKVEGMSSKLALEIFNTQAALLTGFVTAAMLPEEIECVIEEKNLYVFKTNVLKNTTRALEHYLNGIKLSL